MVEAGIGRTHVDMVAGENLVYVPEERGAVAPTDRDTLDLAAVAYNSILLGAVFSERIVEKQVPLERKAGT